MPEILLYAGVERIFGRFMMTDDCSKVYQFGSSLWFLTSPRFNFAGN